MINMDDLVDEWHLDYEGPLELVPFLVSKTEFSEEQVIFWIEKGYLPGEEE